MEARFLTVRSAAIYLDCKPATVRGWVNADLIPCIRIRHRNPTGCGHHHCTIRIDKTQLDEFLLRRSR
ncbi:MAG: helix-turn-helix domain-containing protein [Candidatus Aminicenantales bacterium]